MTQSMINTKEESLLLFRIEELVAAIDAGAITMADLRENLAEVAYLLRDGYLEQRKAKALAEWDPNYNWAGI